MFDRKTALEIIQNDNVRNLFRISLAGYTVKINDVSINVRKVDVENDIYRVTVTDRSVFIYPLVPLHIVEEMTPEQAVDRFQEFLAQLIVSNALFGWMNGNR